MSFRDLIPFNWKKEQDVPVRHEPATEQSDPFGTFHREFDAMFERFRRDFDSLLPVAHGDSGHWTPAVNVRETEQELVIEAELPGIEEKDLDLKIANGVLHLGGERRSRKETEENGWKRVESSYGRFDRAIRLPESVRTDAPTATLKSGVLTVKLAKDPSKAKPAAKRIPITAD